MMKAQIRVFEKEDESTWSNDFSIIPISDVDLITGIKTTKDTFDLTINNTNKNYKDTFHIDDNIRFFLYTGSINTSSDIVFDGYITKMTQDIDESSRRLSISGANRTEYLLNNLIFLDYTGYTKTAPEVMQEVIDKVNNRNQQFNSTDQKFIDTDIQQSTSEGKSFPTKPFVSAYKPAYEIVEKFSMDEYTSDGSYIYYVDKDNVFNWKSKPSTASYDFTEGENVVRSFKIQEGIWEVHNAAIVDVGKDPFGHGNHVLAWNPVSMVDVGTKWTFLDLSSTTPNLITKEYEDNPNKWGTGSDATPTGSFPNSYPYTCSVAELDTSYNTTSANWVVNSADEFNTAMRRTARKIGRVRGSDILDKQGEKRYKIDMEVNGTTDYSIGELANVTVDSHNLSEQTVRIQDIQHNVNKNGWVTLIKCEEDPEIVGA